MADTLLDIAIAYVAAGLSVIPVRADGSKAPALDTWQELQSRRPTPGELRDWFDNDRVGIAIICGAISGNLLVVDFESLTAFDRWQETIGQVGLDAVSESPLATTPGGGRHLYLKVPVPVSNVKLAKSSANKTLIETRGEGGYVIAPGSPAACHPSGQTYQWVRKGWLACS